MSRKHAVIRCPTSDTITVTDMSTSVIAGGVFVNGVRMDKGATLKIADGDTLQFGKHPARIRSPHVDLHS